MPYRENIGKSVIGSLMASTGGTFSGGALSLTPVKFVPIHGTAFSVIAMRTFLGACTYALGKVFEAHLEEHGTLLDFDAHRYGQLWKLMVKRSYREARNSKDEEASSAVR